MAKAGDQDARYVLWNLACIGHLMPPGRKSTAVWLNSLCITLGAYATLAAPRPDPGQLNHRWARKEIPNQIRGFSDPKDRKLILDRFAALPLLVPDRQDHVDAAELRNHCRRRGVQIGTIDALLAQLCIRHGLTMVTTDKDFQGVARHSALKLWGA